MVGVCSEELESIEPEVVAEVRPEYDTELNECHGERDTDGLHESREGLREWGNASLSIEADKRTEECCGDFRDTEEIAGVDVQEGVEAERLSSIFRAHKHRQDERAKAKRKLRLTF